MPKAFYERDNVCLLFSCAETAAASTLSRMSMCRELPRTCSMLGRPAQRFDAHVGLYVSQIVLSRLGVYK
jgi:hypothetical protein